MQLDYHLTFAMNQGQGLVQKQHFGLEVPVRKEILNLLPRHTTLLQLTRRGLRGRVGGHPAGAGVPEHHHS